MSSLMLGYINQTGAYVAHPNLYSAGPFHGGLAKVQPYGAAGFGFMDRSGTLVVDPIYDYFGGWSEGVASFNVGGERDDDGDLVGGKWGLAGDGRILLAPTFDDVGSYSCELISVLIDGKWGYADKSGSVRIAACFDYCSPFNDGVAVAIVNGKRGYIKQDGSWLAEPTFEGAGTWAQGRGRILRDDQWYFIDAAGNVASELFDGCNQHVDGMARVCRGDQHGFVDIDGAVIGGQWFDETKTPGSGFAPGRRGDEWFFLDLQGQVHGPFSSAMTPVEGAACYTHENVGVGFASLDGSVTVQPIYDTARAFHNGLAAVQREGKWTFVRRDGTEILPPTFDAVADFADGLCPVRVGQKWAAIDQMGTFLFHPHYDSMTEFSDGLSSVRCAQWPTQVAVPPETWHTTPAGGLTHPVFGTAVASDELRVTLCFAHEPEERLQMCARQLVYSWVYWLEEIVGGDVIKDDGMWIAPYAISFRLHNVPWPVHAANLLVEELRCLGLPIKEAVFILFREDPEADMKAQLFYPTVPSVPHPDDPRGSDFFSDFEQYFEAAFDFNATPPASESLQHLKAGRYNQAREEFVFAERVMTLHLPDVRICYGAAQSDFLPLDARTEQVCASITEQLKRRIDPNRIWIYPGTRDWSTPTPMTPDGDTGVAKMQQFGRLGYCFYVDADELLQDVGPDSYRYREPELMEALGNVIGELNLEPVIMWQRFGDPLPGPSYPGIAHPMAPTHYAINLWERLG